MLYASSLGKASTLTLGTSGFILQSTGGVPTWVDFTTIIEETILGNTGSLMIRTSSGVEELTIGTSGQILQTTNGIPAWVADPSTGHITTAGSSGTVLITSSAGAAVWSTAIFVNTSQHVGIGIGTTAPAAALHVAGTSGKLILDGGGVNSNPELIFRETADAWRIHHQGNANKLHISASSGGHFMTFTSGGNVGIGTTAPSTTLDVAGSINSVANAWRLRDASSQNPTTGANSIINWNIEELDTDGFHSTATNSSIVTIKSSGTYVIGYNIAINSVSTGHRVQVHIFEGSTAILIDQMFTRLDPTRFSGQTIKHFASSGDTIKIGIFSSIATTIANSGFSAPIFWGYKIA
jgi:hypothetical protein